MTATAHGGSLDASKSTKWREMPVNLNDAPVLYRNSTQIVINGVLRPACSIAVWDEQERMHGETIAMAITNSLSLTPRFRLVDSWNACCGISTDDLEAHEDEFRQSIREQLYIDEIEPDEGPLFFGPLHVVGEVDVTPYGEEPMRALIIGRNQGIGDDAAALVLIGDDPALAHEKARRLSAASRVCMDGQHFFYRTYRRQDLLAAIRDAAQSIGEIRARVHVPGAAG